MGFFWNLFMAGAVFLREAHAWRHHHWRFRVEAATWPRDASSTSALPFCLRGEGDARSTGAFCMGEWRHQSNWRVTFAARTTALADQEQLLQQEQGGSGSANGVGVLGVWKRKWCWHFRVEYGANGVGILGCLNTVVSFTIFFSCFGCCSCFRFCFRGFDNFWDINFFCKLFC